MTPSITLLGPQRRPTLDRVLSSLDVSGPVAVVNAGWQERESDDAEILGLAGGQAVNLRLFARWMHVLEADPERRRAREEAARTERGVWSYGGEHGLRTIVAKAASGDVRWFLAAVDRIAARMSSTTSPR